MVEFRYTGDSVLVIEHEGKTFKLFGEGPYILPTESKRVISLVKQGKLEKLKARAVKKILSEKYKVKSLK
jgi:hypothetical protein